MTQKHFRLDLSIQEYLADTYYVSNLFDKMKVHISMNKIMRGIGECMKKGRIKDFYNLSSYEWENNH